MIEDLKAQRSQCTFWCWVLSDVTMLLLSPVTTKVLMHLLVLGAF